MPELRKPLVNGNIEAQVRLNNKLIFLSVAHIVVAISGYNVLFNSETIRKPGTMLVQYIGRILYRQYWQTPVRQYWTNISYVGENWPM